MFVLIDADLKRCGQAVTPLEFRILGNTLRVTVAPSWIDCELATDPGVDELTADRVHSMARMALMLKLSAGVSPTRAAS